MTPESHYVRLEWAQLQANECFATGLTHHFITHYYRAHLSSCSTKLRAVRSGKGMRSSRLGRRNTRPSFADFSRTLSGVVTLSQFRSPKSDGIMMSIPH